MFDDASIPPSARHRVGSLVVLAAVLFVVNGLSGVVLAGLVGIVWIVVATSYTVAIGQLLFAGGIADAATVGVVGVVSFGILFVPELLEQWRPKTAALAIGVLGLATAAFSGSLLAESIGIGALGLVIGFAAVAYSIHRYELVRFGLVET